jgi:hypothetical protein
MSADELIEAYEQSAEETLADFRLPTGEDNDESPQSLARRLLDQLR